MTDEISEKAEKMYIESEMSLRETAAATGISLSRIKSMSVKRGWMDRRNARRTERGLPAMRDRRRKSVDWAHVRAEYLFGQKSITALAKENGISKSALSKRITRERWNESGAAENTAVEADISDPCLIKDPIGVRFVTGIDSLHTLAEKNAIRYETLKKRAIRGHWHERRELFRKRQAAEIEKVHMEAASAMARRLAEVNAKVLDKVDSTLDLEDLRSQELEQLSKTLLNVEETDHRLGRKLRPAEQAMIDIAKKRAENETAKNTPAPAPEIKWSDECWTCAE